MAKRRNEKKDLNGQDDQSEVRCPNCAYFLTEIIEIVGNGKVIQKMVCRSCREKWFLKITKEEIVVGQI